MVTRIENDEIIQTCEVCGYVRRVRREHIAALLGERVLYNRASCTYCGRHYRNFGCDEHGNYLLTLDDEEILRASNWADAGRWPSKYDSKNIPADAPPISEDPKTWPRSWTPRRNSEPEDDEGDSQ